MAYQESDNMRMTYELERESDENYLPRHSLPVGDFFHSVTGAHFGSGVCGRTGCGIV